MNRFNTLIGTTAIIGIAFVALGVGFAFGGPALLSGFETVRTQTASQDETTYDVTTDGYGQEDLSMSGMSSSLVTLGMASGTAYMDLGMYSSGQDTTTITAGYDIASVSVSSDLASDVPVVSGTSGDTATVTGLQADETRDLTANYAYVLSEGPYQTLGDVLRAGPTLIILGVIIAVAVVSILGIRMARSGKE